jgi:UPF0716 protein FxsA
MSPRGRLRARQIFGLVLLGLVLIGAVEIAVAVAIAHWIGPWPTMLAIIAFSFAGLVLVRRGGARSLLALRDAAASRRLPGGEMADAALLMIGGVLMIPPGFILDLVGLVFVLPFTRPIARRLGALALRARVFGGLMRAFDDIGRRQVVPGEVVQPADDPRDPPDPRDKELGPGQ